MPLPPPSTGFLEDGSLQEKTHLLTNMENQCRDRATKSWRGVCDRGVIPESELEAGLVQFCVGMWGWERLLGEATGVGTAAMGWGGC